MVITCAAAWGGRGDKKVTLTKFASDVGHHLASKPEGTQH